MRAPNRERPTFPARLPVDCRIAGGVASADPDVAVWGLMDDSAPLKTLLDLAQHLGATSAKSGRRALDQAMQNDPGLHITKRGRTVLFTPEQFARTIKALEWRSPSYSGGRYRTRTAWSVGDRSAQSTLDAIRELTRKAPRSGPKRS